jgi:hypothetical protein
LTYCSVASPKPKLLCFSESLGKNSSSGRKISTSSFDVREASSPIISLETLSGVGNEAFTPYHRLLAVHQNGDIRCYSEDLKSEDWKVDALAHSTGEEITLNGQVEHAVVLSLEQAKKAILKDREDVLALLYSGTDPISAYVMLLFTRSTSHRAELGLRVFAIKTIQVGSEEALAPSGRKSLQELLSLSIPEPDSFQRRDSNLAFHAASGTLHQYSSKALAVYSLSGLVARLVHHAQLDEFPITTCLRLSPYLVALSTVASVSLIDTQYRSLQAYCPLQIQQDSRSVGQTSEKRNEKMNEATNTRLLSYFAPLDLVIALQGRKLVGLQLSTSVVQEGGSRKRKRDGLLINSLGRGIGSMHKKSIKPQSSNNIPKALGAYLPSSHSDNTWNKQKNFLDQLFARNEIDKFETLIISELGIVTGKNNSTPANRPGKSHFDQRKVHYLLSKMFSADLQPSALEGDQVSRKLATRFFPASILPYLLRNGILSVGHIETSLKHQGALPLTDQVAPGALIHALADWDPSLKSLQSLLESPVPLTAQELSHALRVAIDFTRTAEKNGSTKLVSNGELQSDEGSDRNTELITGDGPSSPNSPHLDSDIMSVAHQVLHMTLTRLSLHSPRTITRGLRTTIPAPLLFHLIDHLRMSLARAGWLTPYTESPPSLLPSHDLNCNPIGDNKNTQISIIAKLLNCLLDAIGSAGWLLGSPMGDEMSETADTIAYMKAEISAALEGVEEATYLRGMLGEVLLYANSYGTSQVKREGDKGGQRTITTIPPAEKDGLGNALPLGLKANQGVGTTKVGAGGELIKRSKRDIGRLKDMKVPKYSFERIVI